MPIILPEKLYSFLSLFTIFSCVNMTTSIKNCHAVLAKCQNFTRKANCIPTGRPAGDRRAEWFIMAQTTSRMVLIEIFLKEPVRTIYVFQDKPKIPENKQLPSELFRPSEDLQSGSIRITLEYLELGLLVPFLGKV